jgi:excisionase family DNA binding protein
MTPDFSGRKNEGDCSAGTGPQAIRKEKVTTVKRQSKSSEKAAQQRQVIIINRPFVSPQKRCDQCVEASGMITPEEAAALSSVSTRTIYRWLETGAIHFSETPASGLLICLQTLVKNISLRGRQSRANSRIKR